MKNRLKIITRKLLIPVSVVFSVIFIVALAAEGNAQKTTPVVHDEWIASNIQDYDKNHSRIEKVQYGDTAGNVLFRLGFSNSDIVNIITAAKSVHPLRNIHAGKKFIRTTTDRGTEITYQTEPEKQLKVICYEDLPCIAKLEDRKLETRTIVAEGTIQDSLFYDASRAGLDDTLIFKLVDVFSWDIDFSRDLRVGDSFKVLFEEEFDDEGKYAGSTILSAEFVNQGYKYTAIRYKNKAGEVEYYSEDGKNLRKTYLKSPVKYSRISSRFTSSRKHPVLGYTRAHRGVDYAAKSGTPIRAIGDGKVVFAGWKNGYGRFVEIRHNNGIHSTAYAHMKKYGHGITKNSYVKQGQIIGYVGMSGLATGPHLHFEFRSRGVAVNPLKIKHKSAEPVSELEMTKFRMTTKELLNKMEQHKVLQTWG